MRWCRRWLRALTVLALTVPLFLFAVLIAIDRRFGYQYGDLYYDGTAADRTVPSYDDFGHQLNSIDTPFSHQYFKPFKPSYHLKRNTTGRPVSQWHSYVDYRRLLDIDDFAFVRNGSHVCPEGQAPPFLATVVHSSPKNFHKREVIRRTWGSLRDVNGRRVILVFILGVVNDSAVSQRVDREYAEHRDLVVANFHDSYRNLTYKHLTSYKWILSFCNKTQFVMKSDDDSFVDPFLTVKVLADTFLTTRSPPPPTATGAHEPIPRDIIACSLFPDGTEPKRAGKWSLTANEYPFRTFPAYCSGVAYFLTPDMAFDIYEGAHRVQPVLHIDDLFLTGVVAAYLNVRHFPLNMKYAYDHKKLRHWLREPDTKRTVYMVADIGDAPDWTALMHSLWIKTIRCWT